MSSKWIGHHHHNHSHNLLTLSSSITQNVSACNHRPKQLKITELQQKSLWSDAVSIGIAVSIALTTPLPSLAIPSFNSQSSSPPTTTPFSQSKNLPTGLENGKIRPCPSINPGCISTNPKSSSFAFPWNIPETSLPNAIDQLRKAIIETQKNAKIEAVEDTPTGKYLKAEVDGGFGRDVMEFLVKDDSVAFRVMATKVNFVYPFTTAFGDSKGQEERVKKIVDQLGWYAPSFDVMVE